MRTFRILAITTLAAFAPIAGHAADRAIVAEQVAEQCRKVSPSDYLTQAECRKSQMEAFDQLEQEDQQRAKDAKDKLLTSVVTWNLYYSECAEMPKDIRLKMEYLIAKQGAETIRQQTAKRVQEIKRAYSLEEWCVMARNNLPLPPPLN